ncbi:MAG: NAD(P)H-binding protein [Deltaproteobacteria bacterium]|nr:NAD(P)H-binding protein [Deltaproteobacteria bacterium]
MKSPFVICGATGNIGSRIVGKLLDAGEPVRAIARERVRLGPLASKGAEPWPGDIGDPAFLERVLAGARGAFVLIPPKHDAPDFRKYQDRIGDSIVSALEKAHVPRVVILSSIGANLSEGTGPVLGLHDLELKSKKVRDTAFVCLRPAYFMENHLWSISAIRENGVNGSPVRPDVPIPMVATKDIAGRAARLLLEGKFTGHSVQYLLGPRDLTLSEATRIIGAAIGKPDLRYVQFPEDEARKAMARMGLSDSVIEAFLEMERGFNAGRIQATQERNAENTTPTPLEEFVKTVFAPAYKAAA